MRLLVQRVQQASVYIDGERYSGIGYGMLVYLGIHRQDEQQNCHYWADKLMKLRIFPDDNKPINRSIQAVNGEILVVSQFTLYGDAAKQNRPSFIQAAGPEKAQALYQSFIERLQSQWSAVQTGVFAADMDVHAINQGPVTLLLQ